VFQEALAEILSRLEMAQGRGLLTRYALIGGFAVSAWGVPRATQGFDFAVAIGQAQPQALAACLGAQYHAGGHDDPLQGVMHVPVEIEGQSIPLQLVIFPSVFTELVFRHVESLALSGRIVPVVSWQVLILLKLYAGGPQDRLDARQILTVKDPQRDDLRNIAEMAESIGLLTEWTALLNLNQTE
jgi:hypothetical protein